MIAKAKELEQEEELRLGYVAFTRARHLLSVSSYLWNDQRKKPVGPSPYQRLVLECLEDWGQEPDSWLEKPSAETDNPLLQHVATAPWPVTARTREALQRNQAEIGSAQCREREGQYV